MSVCVCRLHNTNNCEMLGNSHYLVFLCGIGFFCTFGIPTVSTSIVFPSYSNESICFALLPSLGSVELVLRDE